MGPLVVIVSQVAGHRLSPLAGTAAVPQVVHLLLIGVMGALHFAVLIRLAYRDELAANPLSLKQDLEG
jgi:uncharacterized integral membrane protein